MSFKHVLYVQYTTQKLGDVFKHYQSSKFGFIRAQKLGFFFKNQIFEAPKRKNRSNGDFERSQRRLLSHHRLNQTHFTCEPDYANALSFFNTENIQTSKGCPMRPNHLQFRLGPTKLPNGRAGGFQGARFLTKEPFQSTAITLKYQVLFSENFNFRGGGILPGIWGGYIIVAEKLRPLQFVDSILARGGNFLHYFAIFTLFPNFLRFFAIFYAFPQFFNAFSQFFTLLRSFLRFFAVFSNYGLHGQQETVQT